MSSLLVSSNIIAQYITLKWNCWSKANEKNVDTGTRTHDHTRSFLRPSWNSIFRWNKNIFQVFSSQVRFSTFLDRLIFFVPARNEFFFSFQTFWFVLNPDLKVALKVWLKSFAPFYGGCGTVSDVDGLLSTLHTRPGFEPRSWESDDLKATLPGGLFNHLNESPFYFVIKTELIKKKKKDSNQRLVQTFFSSSFFNLSMPRYVRRIVSRWNSLINDSKKL